MMKIDDVCGSVVIDVDALDPTINDPKLFCIRDDNDLLQLYHGLTRSEQCAALSYMQQLYLQSEVG